MKSRDGELAKQRQSFTASEQAHQEIHATADSTMRSLVEERNRRITAERHVEQLRQELRRLIMTPPSLLSEAQRLALLDLHQDLLATELREVKHHRDIAVEEQAKARGPATGADVAGTIPRTRGSGGLRHHDGPSHQADAGIRAD